MKAFIVPEDYCNISALHEDILAHSIQIDIPFLPREDMRIDLSDSQNELLTVLYERITRDHRNKYGYQAIDFSEVSLRVKDTIWDCAERYLIVWCEIDG